MTMMVGVVHPVNFEVEKESEERERNVSLVSQTISMIFRRAFRRAFFFRFL